MKYVNLGKTGLKVSQICLGTAFRGQWDDEICSKTISCALDHGINFIDTSNVYGEKRVGHAEKVLGETLKEKRDKVVITTKIFHPVGSDHNDRGLSKVHLMREIEKSLKRLQTDYVDVLMFHEPDKNVPLEESLRAADNIVKQGKARYIGFSRFPTWQIGESLRLAERYHFEPVSVVQNRYNLIHREAEIELLPFLKSSSLGLMVFSPLCIGLLSGRFKRGEASPKDTPWGQGYQGIDLLLTEEIDRTVDELRKIAKKRNKTPAQVAIAWILSHPEISSVIIGPDTPEQVEENVGSSGWELTMEERNVLDDLSAPLWAQRKF